MISLYRSAAGPGTGRRVTTLAVALSLTAVLGGCDSLLDVENPNNVTQEDLEAASSVNALVNGALAETQESYAQALRASIVTSDETFWVGSQNNLRELDNGELSNEDNQYTPYLQFSESRWLADEALKQAQLFAGELPRPKDLARAHFYAGLNYTAIADFHEDFAFSDRTEASPPVGPSNMIGVYDKAIERFNSAATEAQSVGAADIHAAAVAMRARTHWAKALWQKLNPAGSTPADPWINSAEANADARAVLAMVGEDWEYEFQYTSATVTNSAASDLNRRLEYRIHHRYAQPTLTDKQIEAVTYPDILATGTVSTTLQNRIDAFIAGEQYSDITVTSAREMRLILAEAAFAAGNTAEAIQHLNANRALDGLPAYDPATHTGVSVEQLLKHERLTNLFLMTHRRWADMYRFGEKAPEWIDAGEASLAPGTFFPIHRDEQLSNCYILGTCG